MFFAHIASLLCRPQEMCELIPGDQQHLSARQERRDQFLMRLAKLKEDC